MRHGALAHVLRPWSLVALLGVALVARQARADGAPSHAPDDGAPSHAPDDGAPSHAPDDGAMRTLAHIVGGVERELEAARSARARLDERGAFAALVRAEDALGLALTAAAAHAWLAEIAVQRGLTAAQAGLTGLAESAFERAASLDAERVVGLAEAPPLTVALARAARERVLARPLLPWALRISPGGAVLSVDGQALPSDAPSLRGGPHLVVLTAPGHVGQAALVDLADGPRAQGSFALLHTDEPAPEDTAPVQPAALAAAPVAGSDGPRAARRPHRWMGWAGGAVAVASAAAAALVLGLRSTPPGTRTLVVDPGPSAP